jgi:L-alanine-DL-glutamate epimerase-like enolase superfamily enzyme
MVYMLSIFHSLRGVTKSEIKIEKGMALAPTSIGLGIDWDFDAIDNKRVKI